MVFIFDFELQETEVLIQLILTKLHNQKYTTSVTGPTLPLDFESGTFAFVDFDGGAATTIANPKNRN
jgi:hypothetical protein